MEREEGQVGQVDDRGGGSAFLKRSNAIRRGDRAGNQIMKRFVQSSHCSHTLRHSLAINSSRSRLLFMRQQCYMNEMFI